MSDERRAVADRLRYSTERSKDGGVFDQEILSILGVGPGDMDCFADRDDVCSLADLIDPTCEDMADVNPVDGFVCSACGWPGGTWQAGDNGWQEPMFDEQHEFVPRYCPYCGARVVRGR